MTRRILTLCAVSLLAACAYNGVEQVSRSGFTGGSFHQMLAKEYKHYALFEAREMSDWRDAEYFADKALRAADGQEVMPSALAERHLPAESRDELTQARAALLEALNTMKIEENLPHLAKAQASFDCWLEQQEENIQPDHIADCKIHFENAMAKLVSPMVVVEETFRVYFDHDSAKVSEEAMATIREARDFMGDTPGTRIVLTGATDTTGSEEYNKRLSAERAQAVYDAMVGAQTPEHKVEIMAEGESALLVQTEDDVREPKNRRVDIFIVRTMRR